MGGKTREKSVWVIDPVHSRLRFEAKYLMLSSVSGWFTDFEGTVITEKTDFSDCEIGLVVYTQSIFTGNEERDRHLRSPDFFDAAQYPMITFHSDHVELKSQELQVAGRLCIHGITESIKLCVSSIGIAPDPMGNTKAAFHLTTTLNRKSYQMTWNKYFDKQGVMLGDEIDVICDIQLLKVS